MRAHGWDAVVAEAATNQPVACRARRLDRSQAPRGAPKVAIVGQVLAWRWGARPGRPCLEILAALEAVAASGSRCLVILEGVGSVEVSRVSRMGMHCLPLPASVRTSHNPLLAVQPPLAPSPS